MQDPRVIAAVPGKCAPATCFVDHIDSYSTNEVAINWNAAFAWLTAYMDETAQVF
jgi:endoglucanase